MTGLVEFFGVRVPHGTSKAVSATIDEEIFETITLSSVALGDAPSKGPHTVFIEADDGEKYALCTLDRDGPRHAPIDISFTASGVRISHTGGSDVYLSGYKATSVMDDGFDSEDDYDSEDDDGMLMAPDSEDDSEEDEEAPAAVPLRDNKQAKNAAAAMMMVDGEADDSSSDEESDDDDDDDSDGASDEDSDDDDDSDEESDEEEEDAMPAVSGKRKAGVAATPQPAKKSKPADIKAPATAPAKMANDDEARYVKELKSFLKTNGPIKLGALGSKVKKPPKSPKLKSLVLSRPDFSYNPKTDQVSLA